MKKMVPVYSLSDYLTDPLLGIKIGEMVEEVIRELSITRDESDTSESPRNVIERAAEWAILGLQK